MLTFQVTYYRNGNFTLACRITVRLFAHVLCGVFIAQKRIINMTVTN